MAPPIRIRPSFPLSQSLPPGQYEKEKIENLKMNYPGWKVPKILLEISGEITTQRMKRSDHELLIAKFRLKLKKVGKTTRPFRYGVNQTLMIIQWK